MQREDYVWVAMRALGVYFVAVAGSTLPHLLSSALTAWHDWNREVLAPGDGSEVRSAEAASPGSGDSFTLEYRSYVSAQSASAAVAVLAKVLIDALLGTYLLCRGGLLLKLAGAETPRQPVQQDNAGDPASERM